MKQLVETRSSSNLSPPPFIIRSSSSQLASSAECTPATAHSSQYKRQTAPNGGQPNAGRRTGIHNQQATSDRNGQPPLPSERPNEPLSKPPSGLAICSKLVMCSRLANSSGYLSAELDSANKRTPSRSSRSTFEISGDHKQPDESIKRRISRANMCRVNKRINKTPINEKINEKVIKTAYPNISDQNKRPDDRPDDRPGSNDVLDHSDCSIRIDYFPTLQCFIFVNLIGLTGAFVSAVLDRAQAHLERVYLSISRLVARIRKLHRPPTGRRRFYWWLNVLLIFNCLLTCDAIKNQYNKAVGAVPGDLVLGALFPVHHAPGPGN